MNNYELNQNKDTENSDNIRHDTGVFSSNKKGFGFIRPDDGSGDLFVAARNTNGAFHQDKVKFSVIREETEESNREAVIDEILERTITEVVGTFTASKSFGFVKPDINNISTDIFVPGKKMLGASDNDKVLVHIDHYATQDKRPDGHIVEILGQKGEPGVDVLSVIKARGVPTEFSKETLAEAAGLPDSVSDNEIEGRSDFRDVFTVTIDGESTKDFDDALSLVYEDGIYHLGIHIADVTHYVKENGAIDKEAAHRGTSVYPVDRVVPMIPEKLSIGICSLVEGEDRLTLSSIMDFDKDGNMISRSIQETVIRVDRRLTYTQVTEMLEHPERCTEEEKNTLLPMLYAVKDLTDIFREKKRCRGAVDFEFPEPEITLDENGHPIDIKVRTRDAATKIIEELMLKANETVAESVTLDEGWRGTPIIYRSHEAPDPDRIEGLRNLVWSLGHKFNINLDNILPSDIQGLVDDVTGSKEELLITTMALRCMKRAMYSTASKAEDADGSEHDIAKHGALKPVGHFGLAAEYYCHFTSPIRRYPDLVNHRIIKAKLNNKLSDEKIKKLKKSLPDLAQHICETEHRAIETERDSNKIKMAEYMNDRIGETFEGIISGMSAWGMYISLPNAIEGMVPLSSLDDGYYEFDEEHMVMRKENGGNEFHIGDEVRVKVTQADTELRIIDFEFV